MKKLVKRAVVVGAVAATAAVALRPETRGAARRARARAGRQARHARGIGAGVWYRLSGRHPEPNVSDDILTQRVRSTLGPIEKDLDLPRVHVMVEEGLVVLHGEVGTTDDVWALERAVLRVPGVRGIESYLHVGLSKGSTRPSTGHLEAAIRPSPARAELLQAARDAGVPERDAPKVTRAVLAAFTDHIPVDEREQLLAHLPVDARQLAGPPRRHGVEPRRIRTVPQLVAEVVADGTVDPERATAITQAVVSRLRSLVPEEAADVAAVLPADLRSLWTAGVQA
jgi:uncharacterized protein (DUF2267 family)